jgi:hypothetical protein
MSVGLLTCRLRKNYRTLLIEQVDELYETSVSSQDTSSPQSFAQYPKDTRDIVGHMWRSCFYKQIAEFRGALKRHSANLAATFATATSGAADTAATQREKLHIARLTQGLLKFLSDSLEYFQKIISEVRRRFLVCR